MARPVSLLSSFCVQRVVRGETILHTPHGSVLYHKVARIVQRKNRIQELFHIFVVVVTAQRVVFGCGAQSFCKRKSEKIGNNSSIKAAWTSTQRSSLARLSLCLRYLCFCVWCAWHIGTRTACGGDGGDGDSAEKKECETTKRPNVYKILFSLHFHWHCFISFGALPLVFW